MTSARLASRTQRTRCRPLLRVPPPAAHTEPAHCSVEDVPLRDGGLAVASQLASHAPRRSKHGSHGLGICCRPLHPSLPDRGHSSLLPGCLAPRRSMYCPLSRFVAGHSANVMLVLFNLCALGYSPHCSSRCGPWCSSRRAARYAHVFSFASVWWQHVKMSQQSCLWSRLGVTGMHTCAD